jgi:hypothetical protein
MTNRQVVIVLVSIFSILASSMLCAKQNSSIPGLPDPGECKPSKSERPWLDEKRSPECRALDVLAALTDTEKNTSAIAHLR